MKFPNSISRLLTHLIPIALLVCASGGCSDEPDTAGDSSQDSIVQAVEDSEEPGSETRPSFEEPAPVDEYAAVWPYGFDGSSTALRSTVLALGDVELAADATFGLQASPYQTVSGKKFDSGWSYELTPHSFGRSSRTLELGLPGDAIHRPSSVVYEYDEGVEVNYEHRHEGMKLFMEIHEKPPGNGSLEFRFDQVGENLDFRSSRDEVYAYHESSEVFRWTGLIAYDVEGTSLPVSMNSDNDTLHFAVDDAEATYPITIDPLATSPSWTASGSQDSSNFGNRIVSGDVNQNGHTDILITDSSYDGNEDGQGRVLLFLGSEDGFSSTSDAIIAGDTQFEELGVGTSMNADFTGDGCHDLVVGSPGYNGAHGRVILYQLFDCEASDPELDPTFIWSHQPDEVSGYGRRVATGDFNCNGDADLLVGAPARSTSWEGEEYDFNGGIDIFYGDPSTPTAIDDEPSFSYEGDEDLARLGWEVITIPELDGRDYSEPERCESFAAGTPYRDDDRGSLYVFYHDAEGNIEASPYQLDGDEAGERFTDGLSTLPSPRDSEVNDRELSAIAVGASGAANDELSGYVSLFEYSETEETLVEVMVLNGPHPGSEFGFRVSGNLDFNGDEYGDLVVGAPGYDANTDDGEEGGAFVYLGTEEGLQETPELILDSGQTGSQYGYDVTGIRDFGDDKDALIVGARRYDGLVENGGKVFLYPGQKTCYIAGEFYSDGDENPENLCEICDVEEDRESWSNNEEGMTCDSGDECKISTCQSGECVETDEVDCDDGDPCTHNYCDGGECFSETEPKDGEQCDDDGLGCTSHTCDDGECIQAISEGCFIDETCYENGAINESSECFHCDPSQDNEDWTPRPEGDECDNGVFCTEDDRCDGTGQCEAGEPRDCGEPPKCYDDMNCSNATSSCNPVGPQTGTTCDPEDGFSCTGGECDSGNCEAFVEEGCLIDAQCVEEGAEHPNNECMICNSAESTDSWTPKSDQIACDPEDGHSCTGGECWSGTCETVVEEGCLIDAQCVPEGGENPNNSCQICNSTESTTMWTDRQDGSSCPAGGDPACTSGECQSGSCQLQVDDGCYIDDSCIDTGAENPANACQECDPTHSQSEWKNLDGTTCPSGDGLSCTSGQCDDGSCEVQLDEGCLIDDQCIDDGAENPENPCQVCDPSESTDSWSAGEGSCELSDGLDCTTGVCSEGSCSAEVTEGCLIDGQCIDEGAENPINNCESCQPATDAEAYSPRPAGASCVEETHCTEDNELVTEGVCDGEGVCSSEITDCGDFLCDEEELVCPTSCEADDQCVEGGFCDEAGECSTEPVPPIADAGDDQIVEGESEVTLNGTASYDPNGNELTYEWSQLSGDAVDLFDPIDAAPTFTAPSVGPEQELVLEFELVVNDGEFDSDPDETTVTVTSDENQPPVAVITGPESAEAGDTIELDGSDSFDPDGDEITDYQWSLIDGTPAPTIAQTGDLSRVEVTFPEDIFEDTTYVLGLIVSDGLANSALEEHSIEVAGVEPPDDVGVPDVGEPDAGEPDAGIPDAGEPDTGPTDPEMNGEMEGSGCVCSSTSGGDTQGMVLFLMVLGIAIWRRTKPAQRA